MLVYIKGNAIWEILNCQLGKLCYQAIVAVVGTSGLQGIRQTSLGGARSAKAQTGTDPGRLPRYPEKWYNFYKRDCPTWLVTETPIFYVGSVDSAGARGSLEPATRAVSLYHNYLTNYLGYFCVSILSRTDFGESLGTFDYTPRYTVGFGDSQDGTSFFKAFDYTLDINFHTWTFLG